MRGTKRVAAAALVVAGLAVAALGGAGCGTDEGPAGAASQADLAGRTFEATGAAGFELIDDVTLAFDDEGNLSADAGCNTMNGAYTIDDGALEVEALASTMMGCDPNHMDQDAWLGELLTSSPNVSLTGDRLTLRSGEDSLALLEAEAEDAGG